MNKQELIGKYEYLNHNYFRRVDTSEVLKDLKQLDEPEKVKVPQFVADWIEVAKTVYSLSGGMMYGGPGVNKWLENEDNQRTFVLAWFDGYEVEKEKRYVVNLKNGQPLTKTKSGKAIYFSQDIITGNYKATRKELEEAGFGWVFDCEGIEVKEVEE